MAETTTVFLSSTRQDLLAYRATVDAALREAGLVPILMERFGAREDLPLDTCLAEVRGADLFVGIYAWRYGFVPVGESASITELEYREACRQKKPCYCFLVDESQAWPEEDREREREAELSAFKARLRAERVVTTFTTPDDLAKHVVAALLLVARQGLSAAERRELRVLLDLVADPIEKRLQELTRYGPLIELSREQRNLAVSQVFESELEEAALPLPDQRILDLFESCNRELLILGEPGAGKTIDLYRLASGLVARTREDPSQPIPVVFKLSAWSRSGKLDGWMAGQIEKSYHRFSRTTIEAWIRGNRLLPLLDGLDEVEPGARAACVEAIHGFLKAHPGCGIAVTCATAINEELESPLQLRNAVGLKPLSEDKVEGYLASHAAGKTGTLAAILREDEVWREMATSPLVLDLLGKVLRRAGPGSLDDAQGTPEERRRFLFKTFVERMLKPRPGEESEGGEPWTPTLPRLSWLSREMERQRCDPFQAEDLEPGWLSTAAQVWSYALVSRAVVGVLLVLPLAAFYAPTLLLPFGLLGGALAGTADGARLNGLPAWTGSGGGAYRAARLGSGLLALFLLCGVLWRVATPPWTTWKPDLSDGLSYGALWGLLFGLVFGFHQGRRDGRGDTRVGEAWVWSGWSARGALRGGALGLGLGLSLWGRSALDYVLRDEKGIFGPSFWLFFCLVFGVFGGLLGLFLGGFRAPGETPQSRRRRTLLRALRNLRVIAKKGLIGLCVLLWIGYGAFVLSGAGQLIALPDLTPKQLLLVPVVPSVLAFWLLLWAGGIDLVQHFTLRLLLAASSPMPFRLNRFLKAAADCNLLRGEGTSYTFYHPLLRDYFAELPSPPAQGGDQGNWISGT